MTRQIIKRRSTCINCRKGIGWTGTQWIHLVTSQHTCEPVTVAIPDTSENRLMYHGGPVGEERF